MSNCSQIAIIDVIVSATLYTPNCAEKFKNWKSGKSTQWLR